MGTLFAGGGGALHRGRFWRRGGGGQELPLLATADPDAWLVTRAFEAWNEQGVEGAAAWLSRWVELIEPPDRPDSATGAGGGEPWGGGRRSLRSWGWFRGRGRRPTDRGGGVGGLRAGSGFGARAATRGVSGLCSRGPKTIVRERGCPERDAALRASERGADREATCARGAAMGAPRGGGGSHAFGVGSGDIEGVFKVGGVSPRERACSGVRGASGTRRRAPPRGRCGGGLWGWWWGWRSGGRYTGARAGPARCGGVGARRRCRRRRRSGGAVRAPAGRGGRGAPGWPRGAAARRRRRRRGWSGGRARRATGGGGRSGRWGRREGGGGGRVGRGRRGGRAGGGGGRALGRAGEGQTREGR